MAHVQSGGITDGDDNPETMPLFGSDVTSGNFVIILIQWNSTTETLTSVTSNRTTGNWTLLHNPTTQPEAGYRAAIAYAVLTGTGALSVTVTFSDVLSIISLLGSEYDTIDPTTPVEDSDLVSVFAAGTGTDAVASGTITSTSDNTTIWGVDGDINVNNTLTTGTGYTGRITSMDFNNRGEIEDKVLASAGSTTATFTSSSFFLASIVGGVVLKAAASGDVKTVGGLVIANVKTFGGLAIAATKTVNGVTV